MHVITVSVVGIHNVSQFVKHLGLSNFPKSEIKLKVKNNMRVMDQKVVLCQFIITLCDLDL